MNKICFATGSLGNVPVLEIVLKQSLSEVDPKILLNYGDPLGLPELRKQIAELYGGNITEENILITSSAQQALGIVFDYLLQEEKNKIFVQKPAYFGTLRLLKKQNAKIIPFENLETIEDKLNYAELSVIYLTSNFHNPTGETLSEEEKKKLAISAKENNSIIIEDNPYDFLYFGKERPNNIFELAPKNTIYVSGFSKILGPGIRMGYIIADKEIIAKLRSEKINQDIFTSTLGQQVCSNALKQAQYLGELRTYFKDKRNLALSLLEEQFKAEKDFTWNEPNGGIFILGKFSENIDSEEVMRIAKDKYGLLLEKDNYTYNDGMSRNTTRINFVQNSEEDLREGIARLYKAFQEVKNEVRANH